MILIGMFDSPFVRRVAVSMRLVGMDYEHRNWSVGADFDRIRAYNPLGRVPTLVLDDGTALVESAAILDWIDEAAGERRLLAATGLARRNALQLMAIAIGAAEKSVLQIYERVFRPADKQHEPWLDRCRTQVQGGFAELERACAARAGSWLIGEQIGQADITATCVFSFARDALKLDDAAYPHLAALAARCEALPAFQAVRAEFHTPTPAA